MGVLASSIGVLGGGCANAADGEMAWTEGGGGDGMLAEELIRDGGGGGGGDGRGEGESGACGLSGVGCNGGGSGQGTG